MTQGVGGGWCRPRPSPPQPAPTIRQRRGAQARAARGRGSRPEPRPPLPGVSCGSRRRGGAERSGAGVSGGLVRAAGPAEKILTTNRPVGYGLRRGAGARPPARCCPIPRRHRLDQRPERRRSTGRGPSRSPVPVPTRVVSVAKSGKGRGRWDRALPGGSGSAAPSRATPPQPPAAAGTAELPVNEAGKSHRSRRREARQNL